MIVNLFKLGLVAIIICVFWLIAISDYKQTEARSKLPDDEYCLLYKEEQNRFIPARCIKYFNN